MAPMIIFGDFNLHHPMWGSDHISRYSDEFVEWITDSNLVLLNTTVPTYRSSADETSLLDLTICSSSISGYCNSYVLDCSFESDHSQLLQSFLSSIQINEFSKKTLAICQALDDLVESNVNLLVLSDSLSVLSALQNFSIKSIRKSLHDKGYSFPPNPSDVMKLVYKQYNVIKARVTNEISSKLNAGLRCSLTLDELTSLKNRRYLNINVHFNEGEIFSLGMLRVSGSFSAENCVKAVETKLQEFGIITEKHIVACVTDGAKNTVEVEDKSHEEDNDESEELVEDLDKALDLEFESGVGTDALFYVTYAEKIP
ncbi:BED-type domain-containing protein [Trichonephila clavipes]|nr:BED-type domain-containing protein [Trichonephila clavipes]